MLGIYYLPLFGTYGVGYFQSQRWSVIVPDSDAFVRRSWFGFKLEGVYSKPFEAFRMFAGDWAIHSVLHLRHVRKCLTSAARGS